MAALFGIGAFIFSKESSPKERAKAAAAATGGLLLGCPYAIGVAIYAIVVGCIGFNGITHYCGTGWAIAAVIAAVPFGFTLPITIGAFFGAMYVWDWPWYGALLFAFPCLAFMVLMIPGVFASFITAVIASIFHRKVSEAPCSGRAAASGTQLPFGAAQPVVAPSSVAAVKFVTKEPQPTPGVCMVLEEGNISEKEIAEITGMLPVEGEELLDSILEENLPPEAPAIGASWTVPEYNIEMVWIAHGSFAMGSPFSEAGRLDNETQHLVTLTRGYWLGKYEVTQGQWQAVMGNNPSKFKNAGSNAPVEQVSWDDAMEFCNKLTQKERAEGRLPGGYEYTLPTEAQWEYACRAGTGSVLNNGEKLTSTDGQCRNLDEVAWYDENCLSTTHPVGQKKANAWGLYDMHGNVREWCCDWYGTYPSDSVTDPSGANSGTQRVLRGGCWDGVAGCCRSAHRFRARSSNCYDSFGFRLALRAVGTVCVDGAAATCAAPAVVKPVNKPEAPQPAAVKSTSPSRLPQTGQPWTVPDYGIVMIWVNPGRFMMGSPGGGLFGIGGESGRVDNETRHLVTLTRGYWLGKHEVTQGQWQAVMGNNPSYFQQAGATAPVEQVSWTDAQKFCSKLTQRERAAGRLPAGYEFSLPTEAQWEYACRAGTTTAYSWGNDFKLGVCNVENDAISSNKNVSTFLSRGLPRDSTMLVGKFAPNEWGLYDMHGNVWEWCSDWYGSYPSSAVIDPAGSSSGSFRVCRGGCSISPEGNCRSAFRCHYTPDSCFRLTPALRYVSLGFRLSLRYVDPK